MKIMSPPEPSQRSQPTIARIHATTSFAELMEGGADADTLLAHRALGFSEAGLLGVHFARGQGGHGAAAERAAPPIDQQAIPDSHFAQEHSPSPAARKLPAPGVGYRDLGATSASAAPSRSQPENRTTAPVIADARGIPEPVERPSPRVSRPERPGRTEPPTTLRRPPFRVRLAGEASGLVVVVDGHQADDGSISNLEEAAQRIASEYGMSVSRVIVRSNKNGAQA